MMDLLRQAKEQNDQGLDLLVSGHFKSAIGSFRSGLAIMAAVSAQVDNATTKTTSTRSVMNPIEVTPTADATNGVVFRLSSDVVSSENLACEGLTLFSAALIFNCAVALDQGGRNGASSPEKAAAAFEKASRLYDRCMQLLVSVQQGQQQQAVDCTEAMNQVAHNMAAIFYKRGDFSSVRALLDVMMKLGLPSVLILQYTEDNEEGEDKSMSHAPMA